jgi:hypothetical protein
MTRRRLDVKQAAQVLGISTDAVHKRVKRGTLESEKDEAGHVFVWLAAAPTTAIRRMAKTSNPC